MDANVVIEAPEVGVVSTAEEVEVEGNEGVWSR
jgi:hypothetical protein